MTLSVFSRRRLAPTEALKSKSIEGWLDEPGKMRRSQICEAFRVAGSRDWIQQIVHEWRLGDIKAADAAALLGIDTASVSTLRNHSSTSIGVLGQWAASRNVAFPQPNHTRWSLYGINRAIEKTMILDQIGEEKPKSRPNRTPLPAPPNHEDSLLIVLEAARLQGDWDSLADRYETDLYKAANDKSFRNFLARFSRSFLCFSENYPAAKRRHSIYFQNGTLTDDSRWQLCRDIDSALRKRVWDVSRAWDAVNILTPWLHGFACDDDEEAA